MKLSLLIFLGACGFDHGAARDAGSVMPDGTDAQQTGTCVGSFVRVCSNDPLVDINFSNPVDIDTDACAGFLVRSQGSGVPELCVVFGKSLVVGQALTAHGSRPLVLAATGTVNIAGYVDVGSKIAGQIGAGANDPACGMATSGGAKSGGAGGSLQGLGGFGGAGAAGVGSTPGAVIATFTRVQGGCAGETIGGAGGAGGGAVMLISGTSVMVGNAVLASGAGGHKGGPSMAGGGGGSGGFIGFDAPNVHVSGKAIANGAGGGGGGATASGTDGDDGTSDQTSAFGGGGAATAGSGGYGGAVVVTGGSGTGGTTGGGGGGGAGVILTVHPKDAVGLFSPAPIMP